MENTKTAIDHSKPFLRNAKPSAVVQVVGLAEQVPDRPTDLATMK